MKPATFFLTTTLQLIICMWYALLYGFIMCMIVPVGFIALMRNLIYPQTIEKPTIKTRTL